MAAIFSLPLWLFVALYTAVPSHAFFRMLCSQPVALVRADPIVAPGEVSTHLHQVLGGNGFDFYMSPNASRASSCSTCQAKADKSNYWTPTLWYHGKNGSFHRVDQLGGGTVYYLQRFSKPGERLKAFPPGFRMLAGDMTWRSFNANSLEQRAVTHNCLDYGGTGAAGEWNYFPRHHCPNGVRTQIFFPSCWDGKNIDSPDHKSHMAYPDGVDSGTCPKSHPVRLVSIFYEVIWDTSRWKDLWWSPPGSGGQPFVLSNGDPTGYAFHGDFLNGWDVPTLQNAIDSCTNDSGNIQDCHLLTLRSDKEMADCVIPPMTEDPVNGWVNTLPGCNAIQTGPGPAQSFSGCGATTKTIPKAAATFLTPNVGWTSLGCARDDMPQRALPVRWAPGGMTVDKCLSHCSSAGYKFAGLEWASECWCGNSFSNSRIGSFACNIPCEGKESQMCGGNQMLAVYQKGASGLPPAAPASTPATPSSSKVIKPTDPDHAITTVVSGWYPVGCFKDTVNPRTLRGMGVLSQANMTASICAKHCADHGFEYAGTEYSKECHCGNELYGSAKLTDGLCNMTCSGDKGAKCGGSSALTVYRKSTQSASGTSDPSKPVSADANFLSPDHGWDALGCYTDSVSPRALSGTAMQINAKLTPQACISHCSSLHFAYAGLEYGKECHCGNSLKQSKKSAAGQCNMKCTGDSKSTCGGSSRLQLYHRKSTAKRQHERRHRLSDHH